MATGGITIGFDEFDRELKTLPDRLANKLQSELIGMMKDHRKEVIRVSTFSAQGKRGLSHAMKIRPEPKKNVEERTNVKRIEDVRADSFTVWKGEDPSAPPDDGVSRRLEKSIGEPFHKPKDRKFLLIPTGDLLTPTGRPRKKNKKQVRVSSLPGVRFVRAGRGLLAIQTLKAGERGFKDSGAKGIRSNKKLGTRERVVGIAVPQAKATQGIDFWGSWGRLKGARDKRFAKVLDAVVDIKKSRRR